MQGPFLRKYGVEATFDFHLYEPDGGGLCTGATHVTGDTKVMKDEGAEANTTNGFVDEGQGYSITLTATEMQAARAVIYVVDQTNPAVWIDEVVVIETYGHANAQHAFDLDDASPSYSLSAGDIDDIHDEVVEGALTFRQMVRVMFAALVGKASGGGTTSIAFRDQADSKDRVSATVDASGNRTAVSVDGT